MKQQALKESIDSIRFTRRAILGVAAAGSVRSLLSQPAGAPRVQPPSDYLGRRALPYELQPLVRAHGERLTKPGKERVIIGGTLAEKGGAPSPVQLIWQLPNRVRLQPAAGQGRVLTFDGERGASTRAQNDSVDDDILESLSSDTAEGFFDAVSVGNAYRLLGLGFRPDPKIAPNYQGPYFDIFELRTEPKARRSKVPRDKRFAFDSRTGLLVRSSYRTPQSTLVQTVYSHWSLVDGVHVPGKIERLENALPGFVLTRTSAIVQSATDTALFAAR